MMVMMMAITPSLNASSRPRVIVGSSGAFGILDGGSDRRASGARRTSRGTSAAGGAPRGMGYGPVLVARGSRTLASLRGARVAIPGPLTTAALLLRCECPACIPVEVMFDRIPAAVLAGEVEAGVIIHESQLTYQAEGLTKVLDFGELWQQRDGLPVPLGLDVVRRDLGPALMRGLSAGFRASIEDAMRHEEEAIRYALRFGRGLDVPQGKRFVHMYVNELTLDMGETGRKALDLLYRR